MARIARTTVVAILAFAGGLASAAAAEGEADDYVVTPLPATDSRSNFLPPAAAVYVINRNSGTIAFCYPSSKDGKWVVQCTDAVKLPQTN